MKKKLSLTLCLLPAFYLIILRNIFIPTHKPANLKGSNHIDEIDSTEILKPCYELASDHPFQGPNFSSYNLKAAAAVCEIIQDTLELKQRYLDSTNYCMLRDYDGTSTSQNIKLTITDAVIENYNLKRELFPKYVFENRNAFLYFIALLEAKGINTGISIGGDTNADRANNLAEQVLVCISKDLKSKNFKNQINYSYCLNNIMTAVEASNVLNLLVIFFASFPELRIQYSFTMQSLSFMHDMGIDVITQSGSFYPIVVIQALFNPSSVNNILNNIDCFNNDNECKLISDSVKIDRNGRFTITPNTENVCEGLSFSDDPTDRCVNHGKGKKESLQTVKKRFSCKIIGGIFNSNNDLIVGNKTASENLNKKGRVFANDNKPLCKAINALHPDACVDVTNPEQERELTMHVSEQSMQDISKLALLSNFTTRDDDLRSPVKLTHKNSTFTTTISFFTNNNLANLKEDIVPELPLFFT